MAPRTIKRIAISIIVVSSLALSALVTAQAPPAKRTYKELWESAPVPAAMPFDEDASRRESYEYKFRDGFVWAKGMHLYCPTTPFPHNLFAIRGWVEGWQAGIARGGASPLPAKYRPFLVRIDGFNQGVDVTNAEAGDLPAKYADRVAWNEAVPILEDRSGER